MSTKFFNNLSENTLFNKLIGIAKEMSSFDRFLAVVGYFRSSGYFRLRKELDNVSEIKILVGINIDNLYNHHNTAMIFSPEDKSVKKIYEKDFKEDIINAKYSKEVEDGILQMYDDLVSGKLEMKIYPTKNLHAKFYLCLPQNHTPNTDGWVIMGSSNISKAGLGVSEIPRYELNVAMKDYDDVKYCSDEFDWLWNEAIPLTVEDVEGFKKKTYLGEQPTPYELYIKVLIDTFGPQVEDDFSMILPEGVMDLQYQKDAVIQGYQMLMHHNGVFLADVVGLGKTMIATMIAKRFIETNGSNTHILVVFPPSLEDNWRETFKQFGIYKKAQFITNGSLSKVLEGKEQYREKEEFDMVIVDEAHGFRNDGSGKYDELQKICKAPRLINGMIKDRHKKIMLLSATPLNNRPNDLQNLLLLFQDGQNCTIDGIPNLKSFFVPLIQKYDKLMQERSSDSTATAKTMASIEKLYGTIREKVIDKVTVRRTRNNIENDPKYKADIKAQGLKFPKVAAPFEVGYKMDKELCGLFYKTMSILSEKTASSHLEYMRYRAIEYLKPELKKRYKNAEHISDTLAGIFRVLMVKRLESSFYAFKKSLNSLLRSTQDMIDMYEANKVIIAPELRVSESLQSKNLELDTIIEDAVNNKGYKLEEFVYGKDQFDPSFIEKLRLDRDILLKLNQEWSKVNKDPKFDTFKTYMESELFNPKMNVSGKIVLFSESVDTLNYLKERLHEDLKRDDVLMVTSNNRNHLKDIIKENFDANIPKEKKRNDYNIIITSDVLAEGVNLHQSNVIVNYDSPWNATRLMQRIGRVNRIGSVADNIYNYMFYPSDQGDNEIRLKSNSLMKIQSFHSAFGEDAQIYSREEIVRQFQLYDSNVKDSVDKKLVLLREVKDLYQKNRKLYDKIKRLPMKSRVMRDVKKYSGTSIVFIKSDAKTEFYLVEDNKETKAIDFLEAIKYLKAKVDEKPIPFDKSLHHYDHVNSALALYRKEHVIEHDTDSINHPTLDKISQEAISFIRKLVQVSQDSKWVTNCNILADYVNRGVYSNLPRALRDKSREYKGDRIKMKLEIEDLNNFITDLVSEYHYDESKNSNAMGKLSEPNIIISETFI